MFRGLFRLGEQPHRASDHHQVGADVPVRGLFLCSQRGEDVKASGELPPGISGSDDPFIPVGPGAAPVGAARSRDRLGAQRKAHVTIFRPSARDLPCVPAPWLPRSQRRCPCATPPLSASGCLLPEPYLEFGGRLTAPWNM